MKHIYNFNNFLGGGGRGGVNSKDNLVFDMFKVLSSNLNHTQPFQLFGRGRLSLVRRSYKNLYNMVQAKLII